MNLRPTFLPLVLLLAGCTSTLPTQSKFFTDWPAGMSPTEIGARVADNFITRTLEVDQGKRPYVIYPEVINWYGALEVAKLSRNAELRQRLIAKFDPLLTPEGAKKISPDAHVDFRVFGGVPLELYLQTKDEKYLTIGKGLADKQWAAPTPDGVTREARYWVDDIYMISLVQVQAFRATHDPKYLDHAAATAVAYLDKLQQPNGLFFHAADSPFCWSRGNGWFAAGMTELLTELPADHPQRARILAGYRTMMAALLKYQSEDGRWRQLVDKPESWLESSGTGMFTFAMVTGVKHGWLPAETYGPAARKAWLALAGNLDENANVRDVCVGTNTAFNEKITGPAAQLKYYLDRNKVTGDLHGQGPILWTAMALLR
jgi:rhamnogalacturonyl hydrolase YesR